MTKKIFINKRITFWLAGLVLICAAVLTFIVITNVSRSHDMKMIKTKEPLLIEGPNGDEN